MRRSDVKPSAVSRAVRFGISFDCTNPKPWFKPWERLYAEVVEQVQAAESMGYSHVWLPEHHFLENGYGPGQFAMLAAWAVRTSRINIGTWVLLLPLHNALLVAEQAALVDDLSHGRLILGVGLGYRLEEFRALGIRREERPARMEEGVEVLRLAP